jgi:hypothetical protein
MIFVGHLFVLRWMEYRLELPRGRVEVYELPDKERAEQELADFLCHF